MRKISIKKLLLPGIILITGFSLNAQGWVAAPNNAFYPVNSALSLAPLNIGIGTNAPLAQLHTTGTVKLAGITQNETYPRLMTIDADGNVGWRNAAALTINNAWLLAGNTAAPGNFMGTINAENLRFRVNNTERMVITTDGNVGIGVPNPNYVMSIASQGNSFGTIDRRFLINLKNTSTQTDAFTGIRFESPFTDNNPSGKGMLILRSPSYTVIPSFANTFGLQTGLDEGLVLVSSPDAANQPNFGQIRFFTGSTSNYYPIERMRINKGGNIGINTATPSAKLHVNGTVRFESLPTGSGNVLVADANGNVFISTATPSRTTGSSTAEVEALKKEIQELRESINNIVAGRVAANMNANRISLIKASPNPLGNSTTIKYSIPATVSNAILHIYNIKGTEVKSYVLPDKGVKNFTIQASDLSQGMYLAVITGDNQISEALKLVVAR